MGELARLLGDAPDAFDESVEFDGMRYSLRGLLAGDLDLSRPLLVDVKLCPHGARHALVRNSVRTGEVPFDGHSEFALGFLLKRWFEASEPGRRALASRPTIEDVYSTTEEIESLWRRPDRIAPYRVTIQGKPRAMYTDLTKGILLDPDAALLSGFSSSTGLAWPWRLRKHTRI